MNNEDEKPLLDDSGVIEPQPFSSPPVIQTPPFKEEEFDIINETVDEVEEEVSEDGETVFADDSFVEAGSPTSEDIEYPEEVIDFRGESLDALVDLVRTSEELLGPSTLDSKVRTIGSWENLLFRALMEPNFEEHRIQEALSQLTPEEKASLNSRYKNDSGKTLLRTSSIVGKGPAPGETKILAGDEALLAFENLGTNKGGGYRIPLYNSGITIDVIAPTGNDIQTMLTNCVIVDRQLGASSGAHYFTYSDVMYKTQILNFLQPLIVNSSYQDWRKKGKLWNIIKFTDLPAIVMTIAAICYKNGYDGFTTKCTRPIDDDHKELCKHSEKINANLFEMIVTRFSVMSKESIDFMVNARVGTTKHSLSQISKYQADLGLEGERITFDDTTFTLRIPSIAEYIDSSATFLADIVNEIEGDNTEGQYEQMAFRYIRTFLPWIATVEKVGPKGEIIKTSDNRVITRELEKLDMVNPDKVRDPLRAYVNKCQLTYVGYPVTECPQCGYTADTPSGMWTFDPFSAFFTLAFLYLKPAE